MFHGTGRVVKPRKYKELRLKITKKLNLPTACRVMAILRLDHRFMLD
jgi:hypothetical protein